MRLFAPFALMILAGCRPDDPARAFEKFYEQLAAGDAAALDRLSVRARATLDEPSRRALLQTPPKASIKSLRVVHLDEEGKSARVEVVDVLGDKDEVRMIHEDGAWRVDL